MFHISNKEKKSLLYLFLDYHLQVNKMAQTSI